MAPLPTRERQDEGPRLYCAGVSKCTRRRQNTPGRAGDPGFQPATSHASRTSYSSRTQRGVGHGFVVTGTFSALGLRTKSKGNARDVKSPSAYLRGSLQQDQTSLARLARASITWFEAEPTRRSRCHLHHIYARVPGLTPTEEVPPSPPSRSASSSRRPGSVFKTQRVFASLPAASRRHSGEALQIDVWNRQISPPGSRSSLGHPQRLAVAPCVLISLASSQEAR